MIGTPRFSAARFAAVATVQQAISATISLDEAYREIYKAVASVVDAPCFALMIDMWMKEPVRRATIAGEACFIAKKGARTCTARS